MRPSGRPLLAPPIAALTLSCQGDQAGDLRRRHHLIGQQHVHDAAGHHRLNLGHLLGAHAPCAAAQQLELQVSDLWALVGLYICKVV